MALNKNTKRTIIILSSIAAVIIIGIATGVITFDPVTKSKSNTYGKSEQCFAKLKKKLSKEKMLAIMNKKKWDQSFCDFL